jgi:DNA polymerase-4
MTVLTCVQIPHVAIAVARRDDPTLADRPLILTTPHPTRPTVYAAPAETGIPAGMPLRQALVRCADAVCRTAEPARDQRTFRELTALLNTFSPRVAAGALLPDATVELDLGRLPRIQALTKAQQIGQAIRVTLGLLPAIGIGTTRFIAHRAAISAGAGASVAVPTGWEAAFLAPQPITVLPLDAETQRRLDLLGLRTIGAVAALPLDALQMQFGAAGAQLYRLARGLDDAPIGPTPYAPHLERRRRFAGALADRTLLERAAADLAVQLAQDLQAGGWSARTVALTLHVEDGAPWSARRALVEATTDAAQITQALLGLCRRADIACGVESMTVAAMELAPLTTAQLDLFAPETGAADRLQDVFGRLGARHTGSLLRAAISAPDARLPERRVRFDPLDDP